MDSTRLNRLTMNVSSLQRGGVHWDKTTRWRCHPHLQRPIVFRSSLVSSKRKKILNSIKYTEWEAKELFVSTTYFLFVENNEKSILTLRSSQFDLRSIPVPIFDIEFFLSIPVRLSNWKTEWIRSLLSISALMMNPNRRQEPAPSGGIDSTYNQIFGEGTSQSFWIGLLSTRNWHQHVNYVDEKRILTIRGCKSIFKFTNFRWRWQTLRLFFHFFSSSCHAHNCSTARILQRQSW